MWYMLRKDKQEIMTDKEDRSNELQEQGYELMRVADVEKVSKCKDD